MKHHPHLHMSAKPLRSHKLIMDWNTWLKEYISKEGFWRWGLQRGKKITSIKTLWLASLPGCIFTCRETPDGVENEHDKTIKQLCLWSDNMSAFHVKLQQSLSKRRWHLKLDIIFASLLLGIRSSMVIQLRRFKLNSVAETSHCNTRAKVTCPEDPIQSPVFHTFPKHSWSSTLWKNRAEENSRKEKDEVR